MSERLTEKHEAEIRQRIEFLRAMRGFAAYANARVQLSQHAASDIVALLAELDAVRAERDAKAERDG